MLTAFNTKNLRKKELLQGIEKSFIFFRHGRTDWNKNHLVEGPQDLSLNEQGLEDVALGLNDLANVEISCIVTSPLKRTLETSHIISKNMNNIPVYTHDCLSERFFGDWSSCRESAQKIVDLAPDGPEFYRYVATEIEKILPKDAETRLQFEQRIAKEFLNIMNTYPGPILLVAHGCVRTVVQNTLKIASLKHEEPRRYGQPILFSEENEKWEVRPITQEKKIRLSVFS